MNETRASPRRFNSSRGGLVPVLDVFVMWIVEDKYEGEMRDEPTDNIAIRYVAWNLLLVLTRSC